MFAGRISARSPPAFCINQQSRPDLRPAESAREVAPAGRTAGTCVGACRPNVQDLRRSKTCVGSNRANPEPVAVNVFSSQFEPEGTNRQSTISLQGVRRASLLRALSPPQHPGRGVSVNWRAAAEQSTETSASSRSRSRASQYESRRQDLRARALRGG